MSPTGVMHRRRNTSRSFVAVAVASRSTYEIRAPITPSNSRSRLASIPQTSPKSPLAKIALSGSSPSGTEATRH